MSRPKYLRGDKRERAIQQAKDNLKEMAGQSLDVIVNDDARVEVLDGDVWVQAWVLAEPAPVQAET